MDNSNRGGDKKVKSSTIMQRFVELSGGSRSRMVIIPTASQLDTAGERTRDVFQKLGVSEIEILDLETRADCCDPKLIEKLDNATGIFFTGGNQLRLATTIGGTDVTVPLDPANTHYAEIMRQVAAKTLTIEEAD